MFPSSSPRFRQNALRISGIWKLISWTVLIGAIWITFGNLRANESRELGYPNFRIHTTQEIGTTIGSRFLAIDGIGRILFSSDGKLSAFDGTYWKRISVPKRRSNEDLMEVNLGPDGRLYVGGLGYWGRLEIDSKGRHFVDYFSNEQEQLASSAEIFNEIVFSQDEVFYKGLNSLVRWNEETGSTTWNHSSIDTIFEHEGSVYLTSKSGLHKILHGQLVPVGGSELLVENSSRTMSSAKWFDGRIALFNTDTGIILFDGENFEDIEDEFESLDPGLWANDMRLVDDSSLAITTLQTGFHLLNEKGEIKLTLDKSVDHRFLDCEQIAIAPDGTVWVTLSDGIAQIQSPHPITHFDHRHGIPLSYFDLGRISNEMVISTNGLMFKAKYSAKKALIGFEPYAPHGDDTTHEILDSSLGLLASTNENVYRISEDGTANVILDLPYAYHLHERVFNFPARFIVGEANNIHFCEFVEGRLQVTETIEIPGRVNNILDDNFGDIWLERGISKIGRITKSNDAYSYIEYGPDSGLTSDQWISIWRNGGEVLFSTRKGALRFDRDQNRFVVAKDINAIIPPVVKKLTRPAFSPKGDLWVLADENPMILRKTDSGTYTEDFETLRQLGSQQIDNVVFEDEGNTIWLISQKVLTRIDDSSAPNLTEAPPPIVNSITDASSGDLLHHFAKPEMEIPQVLPHSSNRLLIEVSTPNYQSPNGIRYKQRLMGFSEKWSEPVRNSKIMFDRIPTGSYEIQIKSVFDNGLESAVTSFPIQIIPPLYLTKTAYAFYVLLLFVSIYLLLKWRHKKLTSRQQLLEEKVIIQTRALREKNIQLHGAYLSERDLKKKAEKANLAKSEFLAMVSHEIRTPMNCIIGMADNLLATSLEKDQFEMLGTIHSSGQSLVAIISDILDFSKIEAGKIELEKIPFSPVQVVRDVFSLFARSFDEKHVSIVTDIASDVPEIAIGDPVRIKQVLINLVGNARKFTQHGIVRIELKLIKDVNKREELHFAVTDTGVGIDPDKMDVLFKAFTQIDSSNTRKYGGTGLGLAISKRLVNLMDGDIGVTSQVGKGSTFMFSVLLQRPSQSEVDAYRTEGPRYDFENRSIFAPERESSINSVAKEDRDILLVEDNPINQQVTSMMLRRIGYSCDLANNGKQALLIAQKKRYKLILMDIQMPGMDGIECTRRILEKLGDQAPPIIAVTAKSSDMDKDASIAAGMHGFLTKPLDRLKLKATIKATLESVAKN